MSDAIAAAEAAKQNLAQVTEQLTEARMALRRVSLRVDNGDLKVTARDLAEASEQVEFLERLAVGAQKAADAAASGQVIEETRAAVAAVQRDYGPRDKHADAMRAHLAVAAAEIEAVVAAVRERNDAIAKVRAVVKRAVAALPAGSLPEFENGSDALAQAGIGEGSLEAALAASVAAAIGPVRSGEVTKTITGWQVNYNAVGEFGTLARKLADSCYRVTPKNGPAA